MVGKTEVTVIVPLWVLTSWRSPLEARAVLHPGQNERVIIVNIQSGY